jgi:hypothetical protein
VNRRTSVHKVDVAHSTMDCTLRGSTDTLFQEAVAEEVEQRLELLLTELALGALREQLPAAEDLEYLRDVEEMLL